VTVSCKHVKAKWVAFNPDGGLVAVDDIAGEVALFGSFEWCSECGSAKIGEEWIAPGHSEPPWLTVTRALGTISADIELWTKDGTNHLNNGQIDQLALAMDHVNRARGFLDRAFGILPGDTERPSMQVHSEAE
jgi:hypothetical protein